jgi:hypothetical protein
MVPIQIWTTVTIRRTRHRRAKPPNPSFQQKQFLTKRSNRQMVAVQKPQPMVGIAHFSEFRSHTIAPLSTDPCTCEGIATPNSPLPLCVILSEAKNPGFRKRACKKQEKRESLRGDPSTSLRAGSSTLLGMIATQYSVK